MARTGYKIIIYLDDNPNSVTYMETYEERVEDSGKCPISEDDLILISNECEVDMSGYTGYRLLTYYNRTNGEYVYVKEEDPECEASSTEEQWVNSGSPYCETTEQGLNTGYMLQLQVQMNIALPNYGETRYSRYKSPECGGNNCPSWEEVSETCHISVANCVATFDGTADIVEIDVNPLSETYNQTRTVNKQDSDCENCTSTVFSWQLVGDVCGDDSILCDNGIVETSTNSYTVYRKYKQIGTGTSVPLDEYQVELLHEDDENCGYIAPQYEMRKAVGQYLCDTETYTKYEKYVQYVSYDSGVTWSVVVPEVSQRGNVIAYDSYDCGKPMYRWVATNEFVCEDNGDDWKLKIERRNNPSFIVGCDENQYISQSDVSGSSSFTDATLVDFGDCINTVGCSISYSLGTYGNNPILHFGDYIETIGGGSLPLFNNTNSYTMAVENTFGRELKHIGASVFQSGLTYQDKVVYLGSKIESIGYRAFFNPDRSLNTFIIDTVTPPTIGSDIFYDYDRATSSYKSGALNCIFVPNGAVEAYKAAWSSYSKYIFSQAEENVFYQATYSGGTEGWRFSPEDTNGVLSKYMVGASYKGKNVNSITSVYLSDYITEIGASAFTIGLDSYLTNLTSITLPSSLVTIGNKAFIKCSALKTIDTSNCTSLTTIGDNVFQNCESLSSFTMPNTVTSVGTNAFSQCGSLTSIRLSNGLTRIEDRTFYNCSGLTNVDFNDRLEYIGKDAFHHCASLSSITIPSSVTTIDENAFQFCSGLTSVTFPSNSQLETIGGGAFYLCSGFTSLVIPDSVTRFGQQSRLGLTSFTYPSGCTTPGGLRQCENIQTIIVPSTVTQFQDGWAYTTFYGNNTNCSYYFYPTTPPSRLTDSGGVSYDLFNNKNAKVYVPCENYAVYSSSTFANYCKISPIDQNCCQVRWEDDSYICDEGEKYLLQRKMIRYPSGSTWTNWEDSGERRTTGSSLGSCVKARLYQSDGSEVIIDNMTSNVLTSNEVSGYASTTTAITISDSCTSIASYCFQTKRFTALKSINLGSGITSIENNAFGYCSGLTSVVIPESVTSIGGQAFGECRSLTSVTLSNNLTEIGEGAFAWTRVQEITIPNGVTVIKARLFYETTGLTSVTLGNAVTSIQSWACLVGNITINTVVPPSVGGNGIIGVVEIRVPAESVETYKTASGWSGYADKIVAIT